MYTVCNKLLPLVINKSSQCTERLCILEIGSLLESGPIEKVTLLSLHFIVYISYCKFFLYCIVRLELYIVFQSGTIFYGAILLFFLMH